jgi:hypothetical protein
MTDDVLHSDVRRDLLTGLGTLAISGVAVALGGRAGLAGAAPADTYASMYGTRLGPKALAAREPLSPPYRWLDCHSHRPSLQICQAWPLN